jgi:hypothetical protein
MFEKKNRWNRDIKEKGFNKEASLRNVPYRSTLVFGPQVNPPLLVNEIDHLGKHKIASLLANLEGRFFEFFFELLDCCPYLLQRALLPIYPGMKASII